MGRVSKPGGAGGRKKARPQKEVVTHDDPATEWARGVVDGRIPAGEPVLHACRRHLADLEEQRFIWDPAQGARLADFCRRMCKVSLPQRGGLSPFVLLPWQEFVVYSLFSWRVRDKDKTSILPGARRFRHAFVLTGKGSGKSPLGAAIGLYMMTADRYVPLVGRPVKEHQPQCYVLATTMEQAETVGVKHAINMVDNSPRLTADMGMKPIHSHPMSVVSTVRGSYLRAVGLSSKQGGAAGLHPHYLQWEEMHEQPDRERLDDYLAGFKSRTQPLLLMVTNAGRSRNSVGYDEYNHAKEAAKGHPDHSTYFSFVAECGEGDIPDNRWYPQKKTWIKANPSLGTTIRDDIILEQIRRAKHETQRIEVKRLYFSIWSEHNDDFISQEQWERAEVENFDRDGVKDGKLAGATLYLGLDTAASDDMCAMAYLWACTDGKWRLRVKYWSPGDTFEERAQMCTGHLLDWRKEGWITTPGGGVLDLRLIAKDIKQAVEEWDCKYVATDSYRINDLRNALENVGQSFWEHTDSSWKPGRRGPSGSIEVIQHPQTYMKRARTDGRDLWMEGSINLFQGMLLGTDEGGPTLEVEHNPVLSWNRASAVVAADTQDNRRFDKKSTRAHMQGKIDGLVASTHAVGIGKIEFARGNRKSPWEDPNYRWV